MTLRGDDSALESIPLRLMIVCIVAALSVVPAAEALQDLKSKDFVRRAALGLDQLVAAAEIVGTEGPGSVRTLSFDFGCRGPNKFQSLSIGDREGGPNATAVILELSTGAKMVRCANEPPVLLRSASGIGLTIFDPAPTIRLSCRLDGNTWHVLVEAS